MVTETGQIVSLIICQQSLAPFPNLSFSQLSELKLVKTWEGKDFAGFHGESNSFVLGVVSQYTTMFSGCGGHWCQPPSLSVCCVAWDLLRVCLWVAGSGFGLRSLCALGGALGASVWTSWICVRVSEISLP